MDRSSPPLVCSAPAAGDDGASEPSRIGTYNNDNVNQQMFSE